MSAAFVKSEEQPCLLPIFVPRGKCKTSWNVGYINKKGNLLIDPTFEDGTRFHSGLAPVKLNSKWGFMNTRGNVTIKPRFSKPAYFDSDIASAHNGRGYGVLDARGTFQLLPKFKEIVAFSEGMAHFSQGHLSQKMLHGYIDRTGRIAIAPIFEGAYSFSEGLAAVKLDGLWGYINQAGDFQIEPRFQISRNSKGRELFAVGSFSREGLAPVPVDGEVGFIDRRGNIAFTVHFDAALPFREERAIVRRNELFGFIDASGKTIVEPRFSLCYPFSGGWAPVEITETGRKKKWGFIDKGGSWIVEPKFLGALDITNDLSLVETETSLAYINQEGEFVWEGPFVEYRRFGL